MKIYNVSRTMQQNKSQNVNQAVQTQVALLPHYKNVTNRYQWALVIQFIFRVIIFSPFQDQTITKRSFSNHIQWQIIKPNSHFRKCFTTFSNWLQRIDTTGYFPCIREEIPTTRQLILKLQCIKMLQSTVYKLLLLSATY